MASNTASGKTTIVPHDESGFTPTDVLQRAEKGDSIESILDDLKADGYDPAIFKSGTPAATEVKNFELRVRGDSDE